MVHIRNMNTIYLVRHGENPANITHEFSHKLVDYSLTPKGILQAQQTAEFFKDKHIHEIFASPLKRAKETAEIIAEPSALPVTIIEHFREVNVGDFEGMAPTRENWNLHDSYFREWFTGNYEACFPGGENYLTLLKRMQMGLLEVTRGKSHRNIVIAAHGGIFTATVGVICQGVKIGDLVRQPNHKCAVTTIELETEGDELRGTLKSWASCAHLSGEAAHFVSGSPFIQGMEDARKAKARS